MRLLYVPIARDTIETLTTIARRERRRPQDQAAYLLEKALREAVRDIALKDEKVRTASE